MAFQFGALQGLLAQECLGRPVEDHMVAGEDVEGARDALDELYGVAQLCNAARNSRDLLDRVDAGQSHCKGHVHTLIRVKA